MASRFQPMQQPLIQHCDLVMNGESYQKSRLQTLDHIINGVDNKKTTRPMTPFSLKLVYNCANIVVWLSLGTNSTYCNVGVGLRVRHAKVLSMATVKTENVAL